MKKEKGISLIVLLLIIVSVIIISSVTIYIILTKNKSNNSTNNLNIMFNTANNEQILSENGSKKDSIIDYNPDEEYTELSYYYITVMDSSYASWWSDSSRYDTSREDYNNILKEITYERYVYKNNNWILAENINNSPFFSQTGKGIIVNSERYYIPIYELEKGKNKIVVTEITNGGTKKQKEFIVNRINSKYDSMYQIENVNKSDTLTLNLYQDEINININDYDNILLTGSFYSNNDIKDITWTRYEHEYGSDEWTVIPKSQTNKVYYQSEGKAKILGNYWAIDVLSADDDGVKIKIIATDSLGKTITKTVLINNISQSNYELEDYNYSEENITTDDGISFINNMVLIDFNLNVKESRCKEIIQEISGKIISSDASLKEYEVQVNNTFDTYSSIEKYCEMLEKKYDEIDMVTANELYDISF